MHRTTRGSFIAFLCVLTERAGEYIVCIMVFFLSPFCCKRGRRRERGTLKKNEEQERAGGPCSLGEAQTTRKAFVFYGKRDGFSFFSFS